MSKPYELKRSALRHIERASPKALQFVQALNYMADQRNEEFKLAQHKRWAEQRVRLLEVPIISEERLREISN